MSIDPVSLAITAAVTAINMAVTASRTMEGPRLKDTSATVADYGTPLNYFLGQRVLPCPCFFAKPIVEKRNKRKGKSGKTVDYTGFGTWASHIADHPITAVLKVWFDNHLVYDATGDEEKTYPLGDGYELEANFRVYLGGEDQEPDPDMLAYIEARDGPGTCPAYRPTSYIYFENIPLEKIGNRFPAVQVLVGESAVLSVAEETTIEFVGQQQIDNPGNAGDSVAWALTNGIDTEPAAGDLVLVANGAGRYPFDSGDAFLGGVAGYTALDDEYFAQSILADFKFRIWYKFMGVSPDPTIDVGGGDITNGASDRNAFQVMVFRGVDPDDFLASEVSSVSGIGPSSYDPADILLGSAVFDPGDIGGTVTNCHYVFRSFGLNALATGQVLPVVMGAQCTGDGGDEGVGNMLHIYQFNSTGGSGSRSVRPMGLWGREVLVGTGTSLAAVMNMVSPRIRMDEVDYDWSSGAAVTFEGYNWTQGTGRQIIEPLLELFDVDVRPHEFGLEVVLRGQDSLGVIPTREMVRGKDAGPPYALKDKADSDLPRRIFVVYADQDADQNPNVAMPPGPDPDAAGSVREMSIDMQTLAMVPSYAQQVAERSLRRARFGRTSSEFALTRQRLALEPGDVFTPVFDDRAWTMRNTKLTIGADGILVGEWERDAPEVAVLSGSAGGGSEGYVTEEIPDALATEGKVIDTALVLDSHEQSAPLAYLAAGPEEPGTWTGGEYAKSETGELDSYTTGWDGISADAGSIIGQCTSELPDALPWVPDMGSTLLVTLNWGELTAASLEELLLDPTLNLAAIRSGTGWELVQFLTPTLVGELQYSIAGLLRGRRGTEWAMDGHQVGDDFVLMEAAKIHTMGAAEIGDTDYYVVSTFGVEPDQDDAFSEPYTGASHKPLAAVYGEVTMDEASPGAGDVLFDATRRTRIGGGNLDNQDVPLGETAEAWSLDIIDNTVSPVALKRTIDSSSLPIRYTEAMQIADWGAALSASSPIVIPEANLYQVSPPLTLRGYPLNFPEQTL